MNEAEPSPASAPGVVPMQAHEDRPEPWLGDPPFTDPLSTPATGLVSLAFIRSAIRRGRPFWVGLAAFGMLLGLALCLLRGPVA